MSFSQEELSGLHRLLLEDFHINSRPQIQILLEGLPRDARSSLATGGPPAVTLWHLLEYLNRSGSEAFSQALTNVQAVTGATVLASSQRRLSEYRSKLSAHSSTSKMSFMLVLLQRINAPSIYLAPVMSAFEDVERLFAKLYPQQVSFERRYLAPSLPTDDLRRQPRLDWARTEQLLKADAWWGGPRGRVLRVDQRELLPKVRELVRAPADQSVVVAVGANIKPTPNASFALWDVTDDHDAVIALSPLNPHFWGLTAEEGRMERVKITVQRLRAATCAVVGRLRGLQPCSNPECYMLHEPISSIDQLDEMRVIGPEHEVDGAIEGSIFESSDFSVDGEDSL